METSDTKKPLVSVVMPTYNHALFIGEAIRSVLSQTYQHLELIIIDNYSPDNTEAMIADYAKNDPRIRYEKFSNKGIIAASRNQGMRRARGEYIAFIDSDDVWLPEKLAKQVEFLEENKEIYLVYTKCIIQRDGKQLAVHPKKPKSGYIFNDLFLHFNFIDSPTVMIRNTKEGNAYFFDEDRKLVAVEDYALWLSIARQKKVSFINEPLAIYRIHSKGMSTGAFSNFRKCGLVLKKFSPFVSKSILLKAYFNFYTNLSNVGILVLMMGAKRLLMGNDEKIER